MVSSSSRTKIFPSPIFPVLALRRIASTTSVQLRVVHRDLDLRLRREVDLVLRAPVDLGVALLAAVPLHLA